MTRPSTHAHELTLYFYPSPGVSWKSPAHLTLSTALTKLTNQPRSIGHVSIRVRSEGDRLIDFHTGMTQSQKNEGRAEVLKLGYGLGILFHDFDGELEHTEALDAEISTRSRKPGKLSYIRFEITRAIAERVEKYLQAFAACGADKHYGSPHRPLYGEGGGCSAFAASFLEVAGLLTPEHRERWARNHLLPRSHVGGPKTGNRVGVLQMLTRFAWAQENEPHEKFFIWDPDLMHHWLTEVWNRESKTPSKLYRTETWNQAKGLVVDAREGVCPTGDFFLGSPDPSRYFKRPV